ncbi:MAG: hypothetical protein AB8H03_20670 [Saprospiraceae bacterium]
MIKKTNFYFFLFIVLFLTLGKSYANNFSTSKLTCAIDVLDTQDDSKNKNHQSQKTKTFKKKKKGKLKNWWQRNKKNTLLALLGGGILGFFFQKKKKKRRRRTDYSTEWSVFFLFLLGLAGSGGLGVLFGFSFWTGVLWGLIAFAFIALVIGLIAIAYNNV